MRTLAILISAMALVACASQPTPPGGPLASQVPPPIEDQLQKIGRVVAPPPTAALYAPLQQKEPYAGVKVARSVAYGPDARHLLDVFTPESTVGLRPVLVFMHGGAFIAGNRRIGDSPFYDNIMLWAVKSGMVGVNMTYRLAPRHPWPAAQQDIASALGWVRQNIATHGGDPARIILMGHSAGGAHVAQYVAHTQFHVAPGGGIAGAVMLSGIFDITAIKADPPAQAYFGREASLYAQRSALPGMLTSRVPMLVAYAELDPPLFQQQGEQIHATLCQAGKCPALVKLLGHSHMSEVYAINTDDHALTDAILAFVRTLR